jgi:hypothetical protein
MMLAPSTITTIRRPATTSEETSMTTAMMKQMRAAVVLALVCACGAAAAQPSGGASEREAAAPPQNQTTQLVVQIARVKPEDVAEWRALQQNEVTPALKKAGVETRSVTQTVFGNLQEFVSIRPLSFGEFDGTGPLQKALGEREGDALLAKLQTAIESSTRFVLNRQDEFTVGDMNAPIRQTIYYRINPGEQQQYREFVRNELMPLNRRAVMEGKIAGFTVSITGVGSEEPGLWVHTTLLPNVAALQKGGVPLQMLGPAGAQALNAKGAQLRTVHHSVVRRRIPELSY